MAADSANELEGIYSTLSAEQLRIVTADPDDNVLVLAPPGTGKTHTVIARIKYLVEEAGLQPQELLVLCFTRAAVGEIMARIRDLIKDSKVHDDLRFVSVRTFDSFATRLLLSDDELETDLSKESYEGRIRKATDALQDHESAASYIVGECRHFIVDEIQDVVGYRADLVKAIIRMAYGGFTFLGDPAQAIYGFTSGDPEHENGGPGSAANSELVDWVRKERWPGGLDVIELTRNYRTSGRIDSFGRTARGIVLDSGTDEEAYRALVRMLEDTDKIARGESASRDLYDSEKSSICILCRTNGELLQLASVLAEKDIQFFIRPRSTEHSLPPWIGRVLSTSRELRLSLPMFEELWQVQVGDVLDISAGQAFNWLKRVEGGQKPTLNVRTLHQRLHRGYRLPDEADAALASPHGHVSLSTIHSAKGREFDHVIMLTPDGNGAGSTTGWREEARVLYVAATRARELLSRMGRDDLATSTWKETLPSGRQRWVTRRGRYYYVEIGLPDDVDTRSFTSVYMHRQSGDAIRAQNAIWSGMRPGTQLFIHKYRRGKYVFYNIRPHTSAGLEETDFANLSLQFKNDLEAIMRRLSGSNSFSYPDYWTRVYVTRVVTEVLPPFVEKVHEPFSDSGFSLGIRLHGFVQLKI